MTDLHVTDPADLEASAQRRRSGAHARAARFIAGQSPGPEGQQAPEGQTQPLIQRQVRYRASGDDARRAEALAALAQSAQEELALLHDQPSLSAQRLRVLAALAEAADEDAQALARYQQLRREVKPSAADLQAMRRHWRALGDLDQVCQSLEESARVEQGSAAALTQLELASQLWLDDQPAEQIALRGEAMHQVIAQLDDEVLAFVELWRAQLVMDAALSGGDQTSALEVVESLLSQVALPEPMARPLRMMHALWLAASGQPERAVEALLPLLLSQGPHAQLAADVVAFLLFSCGQAERAERVLWGVLAQPEASAAQARWSSTMTYLLAHLARRQDPSLALKLLRQHTTQAARHEPGLLRLHAQLLEAQARAEGSLAHVGHELIDVLGVALEQLEPGAERVELLLRLGTLYEQVALDEQAAAEVYAEALQILPDHFAALRALGRVLARQEKWAALADLYEHEIRVLRERQDAQVWRRHHQVAQIYEERLLKIDDALEHYLAVLALRPCDLPSLKSCARLMEGTGQWRRLAELFLSSVEHAASARQRLYMLDKVAEIAEHHLHRPEIAAGAWEEILTMHPTHPTAYAALGRLYAKTQRWEQLLALNARERELVQEPLELAGMHLRDAEIALDHLDDPQRAEASYRAALSLAPDYLPALEGLGRLLVQAERWDDLVQMGTREFNALTDAREQVRQLSALAQLCEEQLGRPRDAIKLYRAALKRSPQDPHLHGCLLRLLEREGCWQELEALLRWRIEREERPALAASAHGELAQLLEWRLGRREQALEHYRAALSLDPEGCTWIDGVARCWSSAKVDLRAVLGWLEQSAARAKTPSARERHATVLARLHELHAQVPEAGAAWRERGAAHEPEHGMVRRLTLGLFGDRRSLHALRVQQPLHAWELLTVAARDRDAWPQDPALLTRALAQAPGAARAWLLGELDASGLLSLDLEGSERALAADLVRLRSGASLPEAPQDAHPARHRLRALYARQRQALDDYLAHTELELRVSDSDMLRVHRLLEVASVCPEHGVQHKTSIARAAQLAFPELEDASMLGRVEGFDGPVMEALHDALCRAQMWALLRRCLECHVARRSLGAARRAYLFDMLSDTIERYLDDPEAALEARIQAWTLSQEHDHLVAIVRLCVQLEFMEQAVSYQHELYEALQRNPLVTTTRRVEEGLRLVELVMSTASGEDGLMMLELLLEDYQGTHEELQIKLRLARAHAAAHSAHKAARYWREVLAKLPVAAHLEDWQQYIALHAQALRDPSTAYQLQWTLVRHDPAHEPHLSRLIELAHQAQALDQCARELVRFAQDRPASCKRALLEGAVAQLDDRLGLHDEAAQVYAELALLAREGRDRHVWTRHRARCLARQIGRQREALALYRELVEADPFDHESFLGLAGLLDHVQTYDRARVVKQILRTLGHAKGPAVPERVKTIPSRPLDEVEEVELLMPQGMSLALLDALSAAAPLVERLLPAAGPGRQSLDSDRRAARDLAPVSDLFAIMFDAVGIKRVQVWFGEALTSPFEVVWDKEVIVWLNLNVIERLDDAELRYLAALCAALAWTDLPSLRHMDGRLLWSLFDAACLVQNQVGLKGTAQVGPTTVELARALAPTRQAMARRRLHQSVLDLGESVQHQDGSTWPQDVEEMAHRLALAIGGDVEAAARALLKLEGWRHDLDHEKTQARLRQHPRLRQLIRFAMSESYLKVRYALGLSGRPSELSL